MRRSEARAPAVFTEWSQPYFTTLTKSDAPLKGRGNYRKTTASVALHKSIENDHGAALVDLKGHFARPIVGVPLGDEGALAEFVNSLAFAVPGGAAIRPGPAMPSMPVSSAACCTVKNWNSA